MAACEGEEKVAAAAAPAERLDATDTVSDGTQDIFSRFDRGLSGTPDKPSQQSEEFSVPGNVDEILDSAEERIMKWDAVTSEGAAERMIWGDDPEEAPLYLQAVDDVQNLVDALTQRPEDAKGDRSLERAHNVLERAMSRLEEEFRTLMEKHSESVDPDWLFDLTAGPSFSSNHDDRVSQTSAEDEREDEAPAVGQPVTDFSFTIDMLPSEIVPQLSEIAMRMVKAGYATECCQVYGGIRKLFLEESVCRLGFEKLSIEEVQKIQWDFLEVEISKWMQALKVSVKVFFLSERKLCERVFAGMPSISEGCFGEVAKGVLIQLLNFAEAVAIGRRSPEKLFKILDMYETLRDLLPEINFIFSGEACAALRLEASAIWAQLGKAAKGTFVELENAIQGDLAKNPVPGGAIHPLTRYVMNYMRLACEYRETLEQVFKEDDDGKGSTALESALDPSFENGTNNRDRLSPLSIQTIAIMELLESNLNAKSKLYKDPALSYVFLMNNGRYIVRKVKDSEIRSLLGDDWIRKHSSNVRQYHKNYQRVAWSKILTCLRDEGIHVSGNFSSGVSKAVLKERFKNFNALFEEIHKTQSTWIVGDEQLQAELRISIAEMVIPAYRSFLGRFQHYLDSGRHSEKYIKYGPEELEAYINELFEGTPGSMTRKKSMSSN